MRNIFAALVGLAAFAPAAHANICGTDYQIFNPSTNGLDFVTVQSSETLSPCVVNTGLFFNYAANSLTYSKTLNADFPAGQKRRDKTLGADLSAGVGLTDRWDFGVNVPFVLSQTVQDDYYVTSFDHEGATEIKANTKYRLLGDHSGGLAFVLSANQNLIADNPFVGRGAGPTVNYEVAVDTTIKSNWALGVNFGFRDRNPGTPIAGVPFVPMDDQWIYSAAGSYLFASIDTKLIMEVYGSKAAKKVALDSDRNLDSLEGLIGVKHDLTGAMALHAGAATQLGSAIGGPDWRVYAGFNWAIGPFCGDKVASQAAPAEETETEVQEVIKLDVELLFAWDKDQLEAKFINEVDIALGDHMARSYERMAVEGHTDSIGNEMYNLDLSRRRAASLRKHLIEKFQIAEDKITSEGFGQSQPIADNGNYQGRRQNRRVEVKIWRRRMVKGTSPATKS